MDIRRAVRGAARSVLAPLITRGLAVRFLAWRALIDAGQVLFGGDEEEGAGWVAPLLARRGPVVDVGAGDVVYGDVGFYYFQDSAVDRRIDAYDEWLAGEWGVRPNPQAPRYAYAGAGDIEAVLRGLGVRDAFLLFKHSIEHVDCPIEYLRRLAPLASIIMIITPNAASSDADFIDETHVYAWLRPTMTHMLRRALGSGWAVRSYPAVSRRISWGRDLVMVAARVGVNGGGAAAGTG